MKEKILLLHGALGSKKQFKLIKGKLEKTYEVFELDFEGHGGDRSNQEFSIQLFSRNVIHFLEENSIDEIKIFGYSMGGYVALSVSLMIPEKIKKIITLGTKFQWDLETAEKEVKMLNPNKIQEKLPHYADKLKQEHYPQDWKIVMEKTAKMMLSMGKGSKLFDADFKNINCPVTIGIGSLDEMVSYEESEYVSNLLPNSKLVKLDGVKHPIDKIEIDQLIEYIASH